VVTLGHGADTGHAAAAGFFTVLLTSTLAVSYVLASFNHIASDRRRSKLLEGLATAGTAWAYLHRSWCRETGGQ